MRGQYKVIVPLVRFETTKAQNSIWWGKRGFTSVNDLTCDFGTGRTFVRNDASNIITLGEAL